MSGPSWKPADRFGEPELCPRCGEQTEYLIGEHPEHGDTIDAERCRPCGWRVDFTDDAGAVLL